MFNKVSVHVYVWMVNYNLAEIPLAITISVHVLPCLQLDAFTLAG